MAKKKLSVRQKVLIVAGVLIVVELVIIAVHSRRAPVSIMEAIDKGVANVSNVSPRRKEQLRVQLALNDYMAKHNGVAPGSLDELVPTYFSNVPIDPDTGAPFKYQIINGRPSVGRTDDAAVTKPKSGETKEGEAGPATTEQQQELLIASLSEGKDKFVYDPAGKRDPFRPFDLAPKPVDPGGRTPLEMYEIGTLKLTAVLKDAQDPAAIVENATGRGFTVRKGAKIGPRGGEVIEILPDKILILETTIDFTGQKQTQTLELNLRTKDLNQQGN